ncbi:unnamed protein product, partial [Ascophyllum nodosum]
GASESRSSGTPGEGGSSRSIGGGVEENEGASDGQRDVSPTRGQPGANSGGGVEGGVAPLGKGQQQSKDRRPVTRQSSAASSAGGGGSSSSEPTAAATPGRRSSPARGSVRFPLLQWTLRYNWDAASATNVDVTGGELPNGATMFEAVQLLMFKHSQETEGDVPR